MKRMLVMATVALIGFAARGFAGEAMTQTQIQTELAQMTGLQKAQVKSVLDELANLAYREAQNSFTIPGLGKLVMVDRAARVGRNPQTGEEIQIPAKRVLKFRISKACKDAVLGTGK